MSFDQGEFDFNAGSEEGFRNWRKRLDEQKKAFENRHGVILGRRVRVELVEHDRPLEGMLQLVTDAQADRRHLRFRLKGLEFSPAEIASIVRLDEPG